MTPFEICRHYTPIALLSGSVPDKQFHGFPFFRQIHIFGVKIYCCHISSQIAALIPVHEFHEQGRLADTAVTDHDQLVFQLIVS